MYMYYRKHVIKFILYIYKVDESKFKPNYSFLKLLNVIYGFIFHINYKALQHLFLGT